VRDTAYRPVSVRSSTPSWCNWASAWRTGVRDTPSHVAAEHLTFKLRRLGRRARTIRSSGFCLPDDLLGLERGDLVVMFAPGRLVVDIDVLLDRVRTVGASSILVTAELVEQLQERVTVVMVAPHSPTGLTGTRRPRWSSPMR
jgi:DNA-binding MurR/RpiR family transcriptional regulator